VVFGSDDGRLYVIALKDGAEEWSYDIGRPVKSSPAVADGIIVVGADDGQVYAFGK
jgi:outer membrane protein assembly factor BamB